MQQELTLEITRHGQRVELPPELRGCERGIVKRLQGQNLLSATAYAAGYHDGTTRYLFPVAPATFLATWQVTF